MSTSHSRPGPYANERRSQRVLLSVAVVITGARANGAPFSERTSTLVVNAHGALIQLRERVLMGQKIRLKNVSTNEEISCTVVDLSPGNTAVPQVGVAFSEPSPRFWRVSFPPSDWSPRNPDAKRYARISEPTVPAVVKK